MVEYIALGGVLLAVVASAVFALRMSYEKFCIRTGKPFKSWIKEPR